MLRYCLLFGLVLLSGCAMQQLTRTQACERTINLYARHVDLGTPTQVADLFTEDASWQLGTTQLKGHKVIREYFALLSKDKSRVSHHGQSNIVIDWESKTEARGTVYLTLFRGVRNDKDYAPMDGQPLFVGHYEDEYVVNKGECLIRSRLVVPAFVAE